MSAIIVIGDKALERVVDEAYDAYGPIDSMSYMQMNDRGSILLDGDFTADELERIAKMMRYVEKENS